MKLIQRQYRINGADTQNTDIDKTTYNIDKTQYIDYTKDRGNGLIGIAISTSFWKNAIKKQGNKSESSVISLLYGYNIKFLFFVDMAMPISPFPYTASGQLRKMESTLSEAMQAVLLFYTKT